VAEWLAALPPQPKHRVRLALRGLNNGCGDIRALSGELEGYCRLRVGGLRLIYRQLPGQIIKVDYADTRDVVYENFLRILENK
jgi:mRNA-degrading endonuclease RelE of RelBE toxin-antitoxin system